METKERKKPYEPRLRETKPMATKQKIGVLQANYQFDLIPTSHIKELVDQPRTTIGDTLTDVHDYGLVEKPLELQGGLGESHIMRNLPKGDKFLEDNDAVPDYFVNNYRSRGAERIADTHGLMIGRCMAEFAIDAKKHGIDLIPQEAIERGYNKPADEQLELPVNISREMKEKEHRFKSVFRPDALFGIPREGKPPSYIAFEYSNGVVIRRNQFRDKSVLRQMLCYAHAHKNKTYIEHWNIPNLRVAFVFAKEADYRQAIYLAEELFGSSPMFLFKYMPPKIPSPKSGRLVHPPVRENTLTDPWARAGMDPIALV